MIKFYNLTQYPEIPDKGFRQYISLGHCYYSHLEIISSLCILKKPETVAVWGDPDYISMERKVFIDHISVKDDLSSRDYKRKFKPYRDSLESSFQTQNLFKKRMAYRTE